MTAATLAPPRTDRATTRERLQQLLDPIDLGGRECAVYEIPEATSRITAEMLQARLRIQSRALELDEVYVGANVDLVDHGSAPRCARIDLRHMTELNQRLAAQILDDASFRTILLRSFVRARLRIRRTGRAFDAIAAQHRLRAPLLVGCFEATTTFQALGAAKFGFPLDIVRTRFLELFDGDGGVLDALTSPAGSSVFAHMQDALLRLAVTRCVRPGTAYARALTRHLQRYGFMEREDVGPRSDEDVATLDRRVTELTLLFGSAAALRAELARRADLRSAHTAARARARARFQVALAARRQDRLWFIGQLQLMQSIAVHEDRNRSAKMQWLRRFAQLCDQLGCAAHDTGLRDALLALQRAPASISPGLPPLLEHMPPAEGARRVQAARAAFTSVSWLQQRFDSGAVSLPPPLRNRRIRRVEEHAGNLCDLIVRVTFDNSATIVGKALLPVIKERPALAFTAALHDRGAGIGMCMRRFRALLPAGRVCVPEPYGYDREARVLWMQDAGTDLRRPASADWDHVIPVLARALAAVHADRPAPQVARRLMHPLRAAYLTEHPRRFLVPFLTSPGRRRRWHRFIAAEAGARPALVHGDLCPKNVLLDPAGTVWLLDFDRTNIASAAYDVGVLLAHLLLDGWTGAADENVADRFLNAYLDQAFTTRGFRVRVTMHTALTLAYRAATLSFIDMTGSGVTQLITRGINQLLDEPEPWRALGSMP